MKSSKIKGYKEVFLFSFVQTLKSKTFIITTVLSAILMLVIMPLSSSTSAVGAEESKIDKIIIKDETGFFKDDYSEIYTINQSRYADKKVEASSEELDKIKKLLSNNEDYKNTVIANFTSSNDSYAIEVFKSSKSDITETDILIFSEDLCEVFGIVKAKSVGLSQEQQDFIDMDIETKVNVKAISEVAKEDGAKDDENSNSLNSMGAYMMSMVIFMLLVMSGENIATSIVTEKSSKVIEYMLTSIKPMALIVGKVMSAVITSLIQVTVIVVCTIISLKISLNQATAREMELQLENLGIGRLVDNFSIQGTILAVIVTILGFCVFTLFACLVSSTASRIEEIGETNMVYTVLIMAGLFLNMPLLMEGFACSELYKNIMLLTPITSPFITPIFILFGELNIWMALGCIAIQIVTLVLLSGFVSKVYETLIMYTGNRVKFKQLCEIFRNNTKGGIKHEQ